jgi:methylated-DNA-[protein]-cysteine S-methyltransferase
MNYRYLDSPIGSLLLAEEGGALCIIGFPSGKGRVVPEPDWIEENDCCEQAVIQLQEYFAGERTVFELTLAPTGTTFQLKVLNALLEIPFGETRSYADIASMIGRPKAVRAVGTANGRNPLPIVIPCHRVIGADGSLTGFGGGLDAKAYLLNLEGVQGCQSTLFD